MSGRATGTGPERLDEQDRIAILQMLTLSMDQRLDYFADEVAFEAATAKVEWDHG